MSVVVNTCILNNLFGFLARTSELTDKQLINAQYSTPWNTHVSIEFQRATNIPFYNHSLAAVLARGDESEVRRVLAQMGVGKHHWTVTEHTGAGGRRERNIPLLDWIFSERMRGKNVEIAHFLLDMGANVDNFRYCGYPIHVATESGNLEMVQFLVQNGANVSVERFENLKTALHLTKDAKIVEFLVENGAIIGKADLDGLTPLAFHAKNKNVDIVKFLLKAGAVVNPTRAFCIPPLVAVLSCFTLRESFTNGIVVELLKHGADIQPGLKILPDWLRVTCLRPSENNFYILCALVTYGCPLDNVDWMNTPQKETALHVAVMSGFYDAVWRLVLAGASTSIKRKVQGPVKIKGVIELCEGNRKMLEAVNQVWSPENHFRFPKCVREAIKCVLLVFKRLDLNVGQHNLHDICGFIAFDWHDKVF